MQQEGSCNWHLIGQFGDWHAAKMVDSSLKWCLVNGASIILKWVVNKQEILLLQ